MAKKIIKGINDLRSTHSQLCTTLTNPSDGYDVSYGSRRVLLWHCSKGHDWEATVVDRVRGYGCVYCRGMKVLSGFNDLSTTHPLLAEELVDKSLLTSITKGTMRKVEWRCPSNHIYVATVNSRTSQGSGCPYCSNRLVLRGYNDLATTHPHLLSEWDDPKDPTSITYGHYTKVQWKCPQGHVWKVAPAKRAYHGCPYCSGNLPVIGVNDLATKFPALVEELVDKSYNTSASSSSKKVEWKCSDGHVWVASIDSRTNMKSGCPRCCTTRTSKAEQRLAVLLGSRFNVVGSGADHRVNLSWGNRNFIYTDIELLVNNHHVIVEYDGRYFHRNAQDRDISKSSLLLGEGYLVIRIRESDLPHLDIEHENLLQLSVKYSLKDDNLIQAVNDITIWLRERTTLDIMV